MIAAIPEDCRVEISHFRWVSIDGGKPELMSMHLIWEAKNAKAPITILTHGGETDVVIVKPDETSVTGTAVCSREDVYDSLAGRVVALSRALVAADFKNRRVEHVIG